MTFPLSRQAITNLISDAVEPALADTGVTPGSYTSADITVNSEGRITAAASGGGGGGMTSFIANGDTGTPQTITDGNTLKILGGTALSSVASATDTITMNLDNTAVTAGSYNSANITVDAQGRITAAAAGAQGTMSSFTVAGDGGVDQTITEGNTLTISGGTALTSTGSATDTLTLNLDDTAVTPGTYEHANITVDQQGRITAAADGPVDEVLIPVKNETAGTLNKGTPVYITGTVGASDVLSIDAADASSGSTMPVSGLLTSTLAPNGEGFLITSGLLRGYNTSGITGSPAVNATIYVASGGGLTTVKPDGTNLIQNVGKIARLDATNGSILVSAILRSNDVPNIPEGQAWIGNASGVATPTDVEFTMNGNFGATQTVNNGDLLTISGGSGLGLTLEAQTSSVPLITSSTTNKASHEGGAIYRNAYVSGTSNYTSQTLFSASSPGYCKVSFRNLDMSVAFFAGLIPDAGSVTPLASDATQFDAMYSYSHIGSNWRWNYPTGGAGTTGLTFNNAGVAHSTTDVTSIIYDGSVGGGTITWMLNDGLLVPGSTITGVGAGLVFHAKFEVYLTTGNTRVQEFADVTVESASTGNPRSTMVPASGTLGQQYGGTGVNFNTATDGQLLIGNTGADAALATITEGNGVTITNGAGTITVSSKVYNGTSTVNFNTATDGQILIGDTGSDAVLGNITLGSKGGLAITNGAGTITVEADVNEGKTSGYYQVWWDSGNKKFWYEASV